MSASKQPALSPALSSSFDQRSRRDSVSVSVSNQSVSSHVDREQLAQALDKIHTSASQSDVLTTFNDFGPPPTSAPVTETKGTGDLVQQGLSGFYSRLKEAVGVGSAKAAPPSATSEPTDDLAVESQHALGSRSVSTSSVGGVGAVSSGQSTHMRGKSSVSSLPRGDSSNPNPASNPGLSDIPSTATPSSGGITAESSTLQVPSSSKASSVATTATNMSSTKPSTTGQVLPKVGRAAPLAAIDTSNASGAVAYYKEPSRTTTSHHGATMSGSSLYDLTGDKQPGGYPDNTAVPSISQNLDGQTSYHTTIVHSSDSLPASAPGSVAMLSPRLPHDPKMPAVIDRLSVVGSSSGKRSPSVATDAGTVESNSVNTSAHNSVYHESFAHEERPRRLASGQMRIPGTTTNEGAPETVNARLERMRHQVLSKDFWMADETCKECFRCGIAFTAFRRKHHCRTCGWIFDGKCTSTISGQKFGVPGSLRVCKTCLDVINRRYDNDSDDSDDAPRLTTILRSTTAQKPPPPSSRPRLELENSIPEDGNVPRPTTTPMMAIPATRRKGDPSNRNSAILEIDAPPQLSRPGSSRSLKSLNSARPTSSGHVRHHSKHNFHWTHKTPADERVPFRKDVSDEMSRKSKLPAFHDDNIIDPELAPYMSDESSGDEQMSIFATMTGNDMTPSSLDHDKTSFGSFLGTGRKHRTRGEKSVSGVSFTSRGQDKDESSLTMANHSRSQQTRLRNLSTASAIGNQHHMRSPRAKGVNFKGPSLSSEALGLFEGPAGLEAMPSARPSFSAKTEPTKLSAPSLKHIKRLFRQLLDEASVPNPAAWEKTLIPLLRRCADDVGPNTREGDHMDIRHYVKLKKIPGGKPSDSSYVSGVIFTKNLALKSMPRRIAHPRILIISFPIEYQRQQQYQFMSLEPVLTQEKEFLKMVVARIKNHHPEVVLAQKNVAGLALQSLAEAGIAVAYNVKASVIGAVSRFVGTPIISSMDMLSLPITVGRCAEFEVKTFVNSEIPGRKKTYIFLSGCEKFLGCTIALRGASTDTLSRMKRITEFMVYVVYSLKLESCLLNDAFVQIPPQVGTTAAALTTRESTNASLPLTTSTTDTSITPSPVASTTLATDGESLSASQSDGLPLSQPEPTPVDTTDETTPTPGTEGLEPALEPKAEQSTASLLSLQHADSHVTFRHVHEDVPAPTFYSDMVEKYKTKILSASPFVKFTQPYLLVRAREQETRLLYLKKLRDQDIIEEDKNEDDCKQQQFQLINPEMVHEIGQKAPPQIMQVLHAVHDAEYDKALYSYQTMTRQWENYIQGNLDLFDPYSHQSIVVLYSLTCTETKIPCLEPGVIGISYYNETPDPNGPMDADCTLGQYVQDLLDGADELCHANGCDRHMWEHHRTYVHGQARVTFFVEPRAELPSQPVPSASDDLMDPFGEDEEDAIHMWSYCKICRRDLTVRRVSANAWKYSFGKYLELLFWGRGLRLVEDTGCTHDCQKEHIRYFHYRGGSVRIHYDPIGLLEVVVPRARITWKVDHDLKLKNEIFERTQERWTRFITSVKTRINSIRIDSVLPDKEKDCRAEVERLAKKAQEENVQVMRGLERAYMESKHYEIIPLNATIRTMAEKIAEWDAAFAKFEADYLSDKDVRQLTVIQLRKMFTDTESKESLPGTVSESESKTPSSVAPTTQNSSFTESDEKSSPPTSQPVDSEPSIAEETASELSPAASQEIPKPSANTKQADAPVIPSDRVESLDLATPISPNMMKADLIAPLTPLPASAIPLPVAHDGSPLKPKAAELAGQEQPKSPTFAPEAASSGSGIPLPTSASRSTSPAKVGRAAAPPLMSQQSLTEKVEQLRREFKAQSLEINEAAQALAKSSPPDGPSQPPPPSQPQQQPPRVADTPEPRKAQSSHAYAKTPSRPTASEQRGHSRRAGPVASPPMMRAISQPVGAMPRVLKKENKAAAAATAAAAAAAAANTDSGTDTSKVLSEHPAKIEKKFSDRIGLTALKNHRKGGGAQSAIPRFVHKRDVKKVTSLTQHFEQLSREFEKERNRERKQQAAKMQHHPRAFFPKSSARATVEVYDSVDQAVQEPGPTDDENLFAPQHSINPVAGAEASSKPADSATRATLDFATEAPSVPVSKDAEDAAEAAAGSGAQVVSSPVGVDGATDNADHTGTSPTDTETLPSQPLEETTEGPTEGEGETDDHKDKSAAGSDDEESGSYADQALEDILPDVETIAEHLEPHGTVPTELQQDKKSNLMKMLSNFWAERSASGWPQLEYPLRPTDHIFIDSDVIVREDEPSSLIAFALSSEDYIAKLEDIRRQGRRAARKAGQKDGGNTTGGDTTGAEDGDYEAGEDEEEMGQDADDENDDENDKEEGGTGDDDVLVMKSSKAAHSRKPSVAASLVAAATSAFVGQDSTKTEAAPASTIIVSSTGATGATGETYAVPASSPAFAEMPVASTLPLSNTAGSIPATLPLPGSALEPPSVALDEAELERSLLTPLGTHLKYQFTEGSARMMCKIFYAEQFDALRRKCGVADRIVESLSRCLKWDSKGGKTKSVFLKTLDDRLVMKSLSPVETAAFVRFAPSYFRIMAEALFHDLPSVIAKMLGFFQVIVKNAATGTEIKLDLLIMENLFYDRQETRKFDLKGSMRNRKIQSTGEQNEVLLDENMVEYIYESPLFAREHAKKLLWASVWNDTLFLARQNVMDYSLMVAVDESRKELVVGIIDCIRTYTWDKKLESWIKDRGFAGGGRNRPTVTSPKEYKSRFREAMDRYILQAPNCWHMFGSMGYSHPSSLGQRARFEDE
ncbi:1-phosphatidylinositol-3-phosphate 5-kinase fab1 [Ophiostoma piceae UAMH 11346]|uniref:1-phosphatidylinositol-3-phosphate 5-kinase n=1 Tax=Ophiostoma piceae (strain UAMH 11346) TaxID=1262450 RepID=S3BRT0_OPHP1|nr:1-phosphatidylinositol-3-phosphate 5-kinase fab1 [Ophiostoma piceae UAMH 11346]